VLRNLSAALSLRVSCHVSQATDDDPRPALRRGEDVLGEACQKNNMPGARSGAYICFVVWVVAAAYEECGEEERRASRNPIRRAITQHQMKAVQSGPEGLHLAPGR